MQRCNLNSSYSCVYDYINYKCMNMCNKDHADILCIMLLWSTRISRCRVQIWRGCSMLFVQILAFDHKVGHANRCTTMPTQRRLLPTWLTTTSRVRFGAVWRWPLSSWRTWDWTAHLRTSLPTARSKDTSACKAEFEVTAPPTLLTGRPMPCGGEIPSAESQ